MTRHGGMDYSEFEDDDEPTLDDSTVRQHGLAAAAPMIRADQTRRVVEFLRTAGWADAAECIDLQFGGDQ